MRKNRYSEKEIKRIAAMRKAGSSWVEIAEVTGRSARAIQLKMNPVKPARKKYKLRKGKAKGVIVETAAPVASRPMIALVGNPGEVTATIRELFS